MAAALSAPPRTKTPGPSNTTTPRIFAVISVLLAALLVYFPNARQHLLGSYDAHPTVTIKQGIVIGKLLDDGKIPAPVEGFLGIRYALPPINDLRFRPAVHVPEGKWETGWEGIGDLVRLSCSPIAAADTYLRCTAKPGTPTLADNVNNEKTHKLTAMDDKKAQDDCIKAQSNVNGDCEAIDDMKIAVTANLDEAQLFLHEHSIPNTSLEALMSDEAALKRLRRKIDWQLMPLLCGTYLLQYIDKQALSYSAVFDLFTSTGMTSDEYSWMASIFYFAYLAAEWPASYIAQHYPTGKIVAAFVISWGTILLCTAAAHNFTGLAICRFLLGVFESVITPAFMLIVSQWFDRGKQPARAGLFYCFNGIGSMTGGVLFYGVGQAKGWDVWRIIYVLCGGLTIVWGVVLYLFMPDNVLTAKRFTIEERAMLIAQNARARGGVFNSKIRMKQVKEVFRDGQVWLLFWFVLFNEIINGGIANFVKLIVKGFTHDALLTTAYGIPYGAFTAIYMFTGPFMASRLKNVRTYVMIIWLLPTLIAVCSSFTGALIVALQMPASNVGGYTKRTTATAFVFLAYCIGNIIGPHGFIGSEAPIYQTGCKLIIGCIAAQVAIAIALRLLLIRRNKMRDAEQSGSPPEANDAAVLEDLTDFENRSFRYMY
ncbi:putative transporter [Fusarium oxysporum f. sp. raphani]|uniref:Putative transporter n=1 Tax=Fusarium oxysporum f. sp. raphani TaxID=96318 RepID=A0A8J5P8H9_FUSOX|nr:putative transporter [Fusarium oxysporum f. sp. raphani]